LGQAGRGIWRVVRRRCFAPGVRGHAAPQLHTHAVVFNITETADGDTRALQPQELYKTQQYATAVYRSELAARLQGMGYEIECGEHGQPEIKGYSREYLEASSPRRQQIKDHLAEHGRTGPEAAEIAAHHTRGNKQNLSHDQVRAQHQAMATAHGDQPQRVVLAAAQRPAVELAPEGSLTAAAYGMSYARERGMEREAVTDERSLMRDALKHTMGEARLPEIRAEFERRVEASELIEVSRREGAAGRTFTTSEMQGYERELIDRMKLSQGNREVLADGNVRQRTMEQHPHLSLSQRNAVDTVLTSRDQMMALEGVAGAGKTTSLAAVREAAMSAGYEVEGLAPTSRAAQKLGEAGMETQTLQKHLALGDRADDGQKRLYVVDESSMASASRRLPASMCVRRRTRWSSRPTTNRAERSIAAFIERCRTTAKSKSKNIGCMCCTRGRTSLEPTGSTRRTMKPAMSSDTRKGRSRSVSRPENMRAWLIPTARATPSR
jgi:flagellar biosynthesis GTPase FlhF